MSVKLYSTSTCHYCNVIKDYFRKHQVRFSEYKVDRDQRKYEEMVHKSRQNGVPVTDFNGKIIVGFDKNMLDKLIHSSRHKEKV